MTPDELMEKIKTLQSEVSLIRRESQMRSKINNATSLIMIVVLSSILLILCLIPVLKVFFNET